MKTPLILAAAGSLSAMALPANAAEIDTAPTQPASAFAQSHDWSPAAMIQTVRGFGYKLSPRALDPVSNADA